MGSQLGEYIQVTIESGQLGKFLEVVASSQFITSFQFFDEFARDDPEKSHFFILIKWRHTMIR